MLVRNTPWKNFLGATVRRFSHHSGGKGTHLLSQDRSMARITSPYNVGGLGSKIIEQFNDRAIDLFSIVGKVETKKFDGNESATFDISYDNSDEKAIEDIKQDIQKMGLSFRIQTPPIVDWFPTSIEDLNSIGKRRREIDLVDVDEISLKGSGAKNKLKRIDIITKMSTHKISDPLPELEWEMQDVKFWGKMFDEVSQNSKKFSTRSFNANFDLLVSENLLHPNSKPDLRKINKFLMDRSNWRLKPVGFKVTHREYLNALAFRILCLDINMRYYETAEEYAETDILHQMLSHVPNLLDTNLCNLLQKLGELSLGATDHQIMELMSIYWFTIEHGLYKEGNEYRFIGAAYTGYPTNLDQLGKTVDKSGNRVMKLDLVQGKLPYAECKMTNVQPFYFYMNGFEDFSKQMDEYCHSFYKPFNISYNHENNTYRSDRAVYVEMPQVRDISARPKVEMGSFSGSVATKMPGVISS